MKKFTHKIILYSIFILMILIVIFTTITVGKDLHYESKYKQLNAKSQKLNGQVLQLQGEIDNYKDTINSLNEIVKEKDSKIKESDILIHNITNNAADEVATLTKEIEKLNEINANLSNEKSKELSRSEYTDDGYSISTHIWYKLKLHGLNDYVCAGIMGNLMAEVGGHTLDFSRWQYWSEDDTYGIAQWKGNRKSRLFDEYGTDIDSQIEFMIVEMFELIPEQNDFYELQNAGEAALFFAEHYEMCSQKHWQIRVENAEKALNYFTIK